MTELEKKTIRRFVNRIKREFDRCQYIGDISVSDDEYMILMQILQTCFSIYIRITLVLSCFCKLFQVYHLKEPPSEGFQKFGYSLAKLMHNPEFSVC